jgi:cyclase
LLKSVAENIFIPLTVGGGIRSIYDINNALRAGADKIAINTYALNHPDFIPKAVKTFGSQCIVLSVEAKKTSDGSWEAYTDGGRERTGVDALEWIKKALRLGVGEVLITSIDKDGTKSGYDIDLIERVASFAKVPVIASGGAKDAQSIMSVVNKCNVEAASVSSILHYGQISIREIKKEFLANNINVRI